MLYIKSILHFVNLNYLITLFDTLQYLSLFENKKQKEYKHKKRVQKQKKRVQKQLQHS